ncbi:MAG TPA: allantoinase, partial [Thermoanaerobaculia bacterium]|nr:allantoinase [Thermoanaerobaculia bacterium]
MSGRFVLRSRRVARGDEVRPADVLVEDGTIAEVAEHGSLAAPRVEELGELALIPGAVDPHVHVDEPGRTDWEGFACATR